MDPTPTRPPPEARLEDVVVSTSEICFIDGQEGRLLYRGYDVDDLVAHSTFKEVVLPLARAASPKDTARPEVALGHGEPEAPAEKLIAMLRLLPRKTAPMEVLRTGVSALSAFRSRAADNAREATLRKAAAPHRARLPTLVAAWERLRRGRAPVAPEPRLSLAGNFLYMLSGRSRAQLARQDLRRLPDPPRRPRVQRVDLRRPRHRRHALRHVLARSSRRSARSRARCTAAPTSRSWRCSRRSDPRPAPRLDQEGPRGQGAASWASATASTSTGPAGQRPARHRARSRPARRRHRASSRCRAVRRGREATRRTSSRTSTSTRRRDHAWASPTTCSRRSSP